MTNVRVSQINAEEYASLRNMTNDELVKEICKSRDDRWHNLVCIYIDNNNLPQCSFDEIDYESFTTDAMLAERSIILDDYYRWDD